MADKKGLLTVYKRGQGLWARIGLASITGVFIIWFLVSLDASFLPEVRLIDGTQILVSASSENTITPADLAKLDEYGVPSVQISVAPEEGQPSEEPRLATTSEIRELLRQQKKVYLYRAAVIDTPVDAATVDILKQNKGPEERISVTVNDEPQVANWPTLEQTVKEGKKVRLKGEVMKQTWWKRPLFAAPVLQVPVSNGNVVLVVLCLAGLYGVFRLANSRRNADFLIETESELRKVDWSSKNEVFGSTKIVLFLTAVFLALMTAYDLFYQLIMNLIRTACFPGAK